MANNFLQWNPSATNQVNDTAYATAASAGAATNAIFPSNVANKIFFQTSTFVAALAAALAAQGLSLSDSNITTLQSVLANIVLTGVGYSPVFNTMTCDLAIVAAIESTGGVLSGSVALSSPGQYSVVDSSFVSHGGYTGAVAGRSCIGGIVV